MNKFKFELGQLVDSFDDKMKGLLVIGQTEYLDGGLGYVLTGSSHAHGSMIRHNVSQCEIKASSYAQKKEL